MSYPAPKMTPKDDWFDDKPNPLDTMPIARDKALDNVVNIDPPQVTIHQKMYEIATAKYNPFAVGGSENLGGGSEKIQEPPVKTFDWEETAPCEYEPQDDPFGGY